MLVGGCGTWTPLRSARQSSLRCGKPPNSLTPNTPESGAWNTTTHRSNTQSSASSGTTTSQRPSFSATPAIAATFGGPTDFKLGKAMIALPAEEPAPVTTTVGDSVGRAGKKTRKGAAQENARPSPQPPTPGAAIHGNEERWDGIGGKKLWVAEE